MHCDPQRMCIQYISEVVYLSSIYWNVWIVCVPEHCLCTTNYSTNVITLVCHSCVCRTDTLSWHYVFKGGVSVIRLIFSDSSTCMLLLDMSWSPAQARWLLRPPLIFCWCLRLMLHSTCPLYAPQQWATQTPAGPTLASVNILINRRLVYSSEQMIKA